MNNKLAKLRSSRSIVLENGSQTSLNTLSFRRITVRPTASFVIESTGHPPPPSPDAHRRSILIDSAARQRGFLPTDYRTASTRESIRRQQAYRRSPVSLPSPRLPQRVDAFGNLTTSMNKLSEQRLAIREKSLMRKQHPVSPSEEGTLLPLSNANFVGDIPSALEAILQTTRQNSTLEQHLFEALRRERLQHGRYRLLPITRASCR